MKFSTKDRYALRLMLELAAHKPDEFVPLKTVSENQGISLKYLEQIITPLSRAGLVVSGRGSQGGYRLARPAAQYTAGEILRAIEGGTDLHSLPGLHRRGMPAAQSLPDAGILGRTECCHQPLCGQRHAGGPVPCPRCGQPVTSSDHLQKLSLVAAGQMGYNTVDTPGPAVFLCLSGALP